MNVQNTYLGRKREHRMNKGQNPMFNNNSNINNNSNNSFEKWSMPRTAKTFSQDGKSSPL